MKRMNNLMKRLAVMVVMAAVLLCSGIVADTLTGNVISAEAATMKLNKQAVVLLQGETVTLKVKNAGSKKVTWKSSDKKIATVGPKGKVTAKSKLGSCIITAAVGKKSYECMIWVSDRKTYMVWGTNCRITGTTYDGEQTVEGARVEFIDVMKKKDGYYFFVSEAHNYDVSDYYVSNDEEFYIGKKLPDCFTKPVIVDDYWEAINLFIDADDNFVYEKARDYTDEEWRVRAEELGYTFDD